MNKEIYFKVLTLLSSKKLHKATFSLEQGGGGKVALLFAI